MTAAPCLDRLPTKVDASDNDEMETVDLARTTCRELDGQRHANDART